MNIYALRLLNVARATREADPGKFRMTDYANSCGTPACAFGNYVARGDLQEEFTLAKAPWSDVWFPFDLQAGDFASHQHPSVMKHFGLDFKEACRLFDGNGCGGAYRDHLQAARFIEEFVARKWPLDPQVTDLIAQLRTIEAPIAEPA